jgi:hypothetical protein
MSNTKNQIDVNHTREDIGYSREPVGQAKSDNKEWTRDDEEAQNAEYKTHHLAKQKEDGA